MPASKLTPLGRVSNPSVFHHLLVTDGAAKNGHGRFVDPHFTPPPRTAIIVFFRRGAKGNVLTFLSATQHLLHHCLAIPSSARLVALFELIPMISEYLAEGAPINPFYPHPVLSIHLHF